ncbi:MAG TPA: glycoside hydrolase family 3 C-terminal domain-containing protein [Phycisphaerae bacterium]|nr:glycoside hydrolase family 3 C-terminal domain-containing protein [Phycisphaerae bacterium]
MARALCIACLLLATLPHLAAGLTIPGDYNADGVVAQADLDALSACLDGPNGGNAPECAGLSLDADDDVDLYDFAVFARAWLTGDCHVAVTASTAESTPLYAAFNAVDGLRSTRWSSSFADNQWIQLDFGRLRTLTGVTLYWENAYATAYGVFVSNDESNWASVYTTTQGDGGTDVITFPARQARYLRVFCGQRATEYGSSLWEIEVHSPDRCYQDPRDPEIRIDELIATMTLEEKVSLLYGETAMSLHAVPRVSIPALQLADGPLGIRWEQATAFPAPIAMAASWDPELVRRFGAAMGQEYRNKGRQVWLAPGMNILRVPQCGRNFEYYSEDPYLAARMAVAAITGAQGEGIIACAKHYACNNQEYDRTTVNVQVDERTLREIYLPAFEASVREAGVWSVMAAYNRVNGPYCTANTHLLTDILKNDWGFQGFVVSDWGAVHEVLGPANAGMDLEMDGASPTGDYWGDGALLAAVQSGSVSTAQIDDKARRILRALLHTGLLDAGWDSPNAPMTEHIPLAREIAREGIVLLKNEGNRLPLNKQATQTLAVLGPRYSTAGLGGGGSSVVTPYYSVSPLEGIQNAVGPNVTVLDAEGVTAGAGYSAAPSSYLTPAGGGGNGLTGEYFNNTNLQGTPALTRVDVNVDFHWGNGSPHASINADNFSARWTGTLQVPTSGNWTIGMATDDGFRLYLDGELLIDNWTTHGLQLTSASVQLTAGTAYDLKLEYFEAGGEAAAVFVCQQSASLAEAVAAAQAADTALVFVGLDASRESEGYDRSTIELTSEEVDLIHAVAAANPNTVVVIVAGSQVAFDTWVDDVPVVLQAWYGGQEAGNAIADILFGDENPGAKLPMTFVNRWADHPAYHLYPGGNYTDGLNVGYRYFDQSGTAEPAFPFGFGLSYTTFAYSDLAVDTSSFATDGTVRVDFTIANTGSRGGAEVAQVYVRDVAASVARPIKELKGFTKVTLTPGQQTTVSVVLDRRAFAYYDTTSADWVVEPGAFELLVGSSSRDIRLSQTINLP